VKSSRSTSGLAKPPLRGGPTRDKEESDDDTSTTGTYTTDTTLVDANIKEYQVHLLNIFIIISLFMSPLLVYRPSLWITHKENGP
jgi:hypothetical protein